MKIAVSSQGKELQSLVDPRFGRAQYFMIFDTETGNSVLMDNAINLSAAQGAGIQTAKNVADAGVSAVLSGNVGPKAFAVLETAGIEVYTGVSGKIADAIDLFKNGVYKKTEKPNVEGHWI